MGRDSEVLSVQTGRARTTGVEGAADPLDRPWTSAIWKDPVQGPVWAGREGLSGDTQVERRAHGGAERAVLIYPADHYPIWREAWGLTALEAGAFGENLTVTGQDEYSVCVGDVFRIGDVRLEVSGPRGPCRNLERRHRRPGLIEEIHENNRSGWYARVQAEGWLEAGLLAVLADRPYPQWPIARVADVRRRRADHPEPAALLAGCPALLADWRRQLAGARPAPAAGPKVRSPG